MSKDELLQRIEGLEYDIVVLQDTVAGAQRNFENVSRILKMEREKHATKLSDEGPLRSKLEVAESKLAVFEQRVADLMLRIETLEKKKASLESELDSIRKTSSSESAALKVSMSELQTKLSKKSVECDEKQNKVTLLEHALREQEASKLDPALVDQLKRKIQELTQLNQQLLSLKDIESANQSSAVNQTNALNEAKTLCNSMKKELDKYIQECGGLRKSESEAQKNLRSTQEELKDCKKQQADKDQLLKEASNELKSLQSRIKQLQQESAAKDKSMVAMQDVKDVQDKLTSGEYMLISKKEHQDYADREAKLHANLKSYSDAMKKKDLKLVELTKEVGETKTEFGMMKKKIQMHDAEITNYIAKLTQLESEIEISKKDASKAHGALPELKQELERARREVERLKAEAEKKTKDSLEKGKLAEGLDKEIHNLKAQLMTKIEALNQSTSKGAHVEDIQSKLSQESVRASALQTQVSSLQADLAKATTQCQVLAEEKLVLESKTAASVANLQLEKQLLQGQVDSLTPKLASLQRSADGTASELKDKQMQLLEANSKVKILTMKLQQAEETCAKYDLDNIEKNFAELKDRTKELSRAMERIVDAIGSLKVSIVCQKCSKLATQGKTCLPCGHSICAACDSPNSAGCLECKSPVAQKVDNPLIEEIKHKYLFLDQTIQHLHQASSRFQGLSDFLTKVAKH